VVQVLELYTAGSEFKAQWNWSHVLFLLRLNAYCISFLSELGQHLGLAQNG